MTASVPVVAVSAVVRRGSALLVVQRGRDPGAGRWAIPGGRVEVGERLGDAVVREVREETGLTVVPGPLVGVHERIGPGEHHVIVCFDATVVDGASEPEPGDDAAAAAWVGPAELRTLDLVEGLAAFLAAHGVVADPGP